MCLTVEVGVQLMDSWKDISIKHTIEEKREGGEGQSLRSYSIGDHPAP